MLATNVLNLKLTVFMRCNTVESTDEQSIIILSSAAFRQVFVSLQFTFTDFIFSAGNYFDLGCDFGFLARVSARDF